ncbi:MAG: peptidylprolyl isomerase [Microscillaceae bacterium]|nr:peptidylprolyl isomerase [Microscillaceae bacterium]
MIVRFFTVGFFIFGFLFSCQHHSSSLENSTDSWAKNRFVDPKFRQIYDLQDQRKTQELLTFLRDDKSDYRAATALAFASLQDSTAIPELLKLTQDISDEVREAAAFALGQIGSISATKDLIKCAQTEINVKVKAQILEAMGKCATQETLDFLIGQSCDTLPVCLGQGRGFYRAGLKGVFTEKATQKVVSLLQHPESEVREIAGLYLGRFADLNLATYQQDIQNQFSKEQNPTVRMNLAQALGRMKNPEALSFLKEKYTQEENYMVKVNILRSLANYEFNQVKDILESASLEKNMHLILTAQHVLGSKFKDQKPLNQIEKIDNLPNPYQLGDLLKTLSDQPALFPQIKNYFFKAKHAYVRTSALEALLQMYQAKNLEALQKTVADAEKQYAAILQKAIESQDIALIYHAAIFLREPQVKARAMSPDIDFMKKTLTMLQLPRDIEAYQELQKTIDYLEGRKTQTEFPKTTEPPIDWQIIRTLDQNQKVLIQTSLGNITLQLKVNEAPGSVATFVKLVKEGFYDKKTFHRIVPNFVVQGGCPRGDGFGGLDYTIRSEFTPLLYKAGSVGLASAGKDTESCQFFITHTATPHLDGRYTIFAEVVEGMDVVHRIQIGDMMEEVELLGD